MLPSQTISSIKFGSINRYNGFISHVKIQEDNGTLSKIVTISDVKRFNVASNKFEKFGSMKKDEEGHKKFIFQPLQVILRKQWLDLDLFVGLKVLVFGKLNETSAEGPRVLKIPNKSGFKDARNLNFLVVEPEL